MPSRSGATARIVAAACFATILASGAPARPQCDPYTNRTPVRRPAAEARHCGNGRIDTYAASCERVCSGGCGHPTQCTVQCEPATEACDGRAFGEQTCEAFGFAGGSLACRSACGVIDTSRCDPCFDSAQVTCAEPLRGVRLSGDPRIAVGSAEVGLLWTATPTSPTAPSVFFAALGLDLRVRVRPRGIVATNTVPGFAAVPSGFLVSSSSESGVAVHRIDPRNGAATIAWQAPGTYQLADLATTPTGEVMLVTRSNDGIAIRALDAQGVPRPFPDTLMHAVGHFGRALVAPLRAGAIAAPPSAVMWQGLPNPIATQDGDRLTVWVSATEGSGFVVVERAGARVSAMTIPRRHGDGELLDLALPGGARLTLAQRGAGFEDAYSAGSGAAPLRRAGSNRPQPPEGVPVFGGLGVEAVFAASGAETFGVAVYTPGYGDSDFRGRPRLIVARARP